MKTVVLPLLLITGVSAAHAADAADLQRKTEQQVAALQVTAHYDLPYADTANPKQRLDLFLPNRRADGRLLPVVVFVHGGAWARGDRKGSASKVLPLVRTGNYAGVCLSYRLTDEAKWPAPIHDCKAAIRWIRGQAATYGLDPERIGVWGSSAGGHLVSLLGTSGGVRELEGSLGPFTALNSRVACVVNQCGPQEFELPLMFREGQPVLEDPAVADLLGGPLASRRAEVIAASPVTYVSADDPPFLTLHGTADQRVDFKHAERIHTALSTAGVPSILVPVINSPHGIKHPDAPGLIERFLDRHLRGIAVVVPNSPLQPTAQP